MMQVDSGHTKCPCVVARPPRRIIFWNPWIDNSHHGREKISRSSPSPRSETLGQHCVVKDGAELLKKPPLEIEPVTMRLRSTLPTELERHMIFPNRNRC
jgi:hypothetical protein